VTESMEALGRMREEVERYAVSPDITDRDAARELVAAFLGALEKGEIRSAVPTEEGWRPVEWVKKGILLAFRVGVTAPFPPGPRDTGGFRFFDRDTLPLRDTDGVAESVRIVPGGSAVRAGAYLAPNVVIMPPAYVNVGAWVGEGTMVDSHALVGSCAQIGARVHLSAGAQIGGVLEPVGLRPVIVEDDAMVGANVGVFEGVLVGRRAVLAPGVQLTAATPLYDLVHETILRSSPGSPLSVPAGAVVVPGARPARGSFAEEHGLQLYAPVIVKYRDERTDAATALEDVLR
jgi:2,3,4,5-tetrahydropyridine-2,6-dicarboxylate N-succinyltransferase